MKLNARDVERYLKDPGATVGALVYGPDAGHVSERAHKLAGTIVDDLSDPFRVCALNESDVKSDGARLFDEASALSFSGGRRLLRLRINGDGLGKLLGEYVSEVDEGRLAPNCFLVIEAGDLGPRSSVRKQFEGAKQFAALPCYADDQRAIQNLVEGMLGEQGWRVPPDVLQYLVDHLGGDRQMTRQELTKLCLFLGRSADDNAVRLEDVQEAIGDTSALTIDGLLDAVASGDVARVDRELVKCYDSGQTSVGLLRAASNHFMRLAKVAALAQNGEATERAIGKLRPPVHFSRRRSFEAQLRLWRLGVLHQAIDLLVTSEALCKRSGAPDAAICSDALIRLSSRARAQRAARK